MDMFLRVACPGLKKRLKFHFFFLKLLNFFAKQ
jgi:hypothetical protein